MTDAPTRVKVDARDTRADVRALLRSQWDLLPPSRTAPLRWLYRHPEAVLVPACAVLIESRTSMGDGLAFMKAGATMWGPGFLHVFANSWLQVGPAYLLALGGFYRVLGHLLSGPTIDLVLAVLEGVLVLLAALALTSRLARRTGRHELNARWAVGFVLVVGQVIALAASWGHPEEVFLGLALVYCAVSMRDGAAVRAGGVLGLAFAIKQWAVIGAAAVLLGGRRRSTLTATTVAAVVGLGAYAPFVLFGEFNTLDHVWHFHSGTILGWIGVHTGLTEWGIRAVQGLAAAAAGVVAAWRRPAAPILVPLLAIGTRVVLDPFQLPYYVCPFLAVLALWLWTSPRSGPGWLQVGLSTCAMALVVPYFSRGEYWALADVLVVGTMVWAVVAERGSRSESVSTGASVRQLG